MELNIGKAYEVLTDGISGFFGKRGFKKAVVGLSGGIDSALVACLLVKALGKENVMAVSMPSKFSDDASHSMAKELADNLGIELLYIPINRTYNIMCEQLGKHRYVQLPVMDDDEVSVTLENLQARIRMVYLMALANEYNALLMETGNHTENWLGYYTLYGDGAGSLAPIGELTKMQVYEMARYINKSSVDVIIPEYIFKRKPSAELNVGQVDPFDYVVFSKLCEILCEYDDMEDFRFTEENKDVYDDLCEKFGDINTNNAISRIRRNAFKREQSPPVLCPVTGGVIIA